MPSADLPSPMCSAALRYARHGWPVFPCRERDETVRLANGNERTYKAKSPYTGAGFKDATTDEARIRDWWRRWPNALIGLATGRNGCFVLDFDPRHDAETGEIFTLEQLKADLEEQMGCALPPSLTAITQSEGVHVYLRQPDGEPIRNRGNLPRHVDVRGEGGYVIAPPSVTYHDDGTEKGRYRWYRGKLGDEAVEAPAALVEILRSSAKRARAAAPAETDAAEPSTRSAPPLNRSDDPADVVRRRYALRALEDECAELEKTPEGGGRHGGRNRGIYFAALKLGGYVAGGWLSESLVRAALRDVVRNMPNNQDPDGAEQTLENGLRDGMQNPHDLSDVGTRARPSSAQANGSSRAGRPAAASSPSFGSPPDRSSPPPPDFDDDGQSSHAGGNGDKGRELGCGPGADGGWGDDLTLACAMMPQTDLGNLERFLARYGANFLYVEAWGWLAWDGQRWNRDMAVPMIGRAVQETMRLMQDEADLVRYSGVPFPPKGGDIELRDDDDDDRNRDRHPDDDDAERDPDFIADYRKKRRKLKSAMWYRQRLLARETGGEGPRHNAIVQVKSNGDIVLLSDKIAGWGRASEGAGHISCIAKMAEARLSARTDDFDADPLAVNVQNGTLQFHRPEDGAPARVERRDHNRGDRMTKIARVIYNPKAASPIFDAFLARVQPNEDMRAFLDCWAGYNALGLADAQKMAIFYGEGSNGKGVWVQTIAWLLGDYAWATGIETFMDGKKRNGGGPSPDLAALAGRRMVYANEPDDSSKFSDGLLKALTSDEPIGGVRELLRPPFELLVTWANTIMANTLPRIGTDWGTRRRTQVVPWDIIIPKEERDLQLKHKIRAEMPGVFNRIIAGALAYLTDGLPMPEAMIEATQQYHEENDLLMMFLDLCIARSPGDKLGATALHRLFEAWQTWAQQLPASGKAWSAKYLNAQMQKKGFKINKASTMQWHDIVARFDPDHFTDHDGKPVVRELPSPRHQDKPSAGQLPGAAPPASSAPPPPVQGRYDDDDLPP